MSFSTEVKGELIRLPYGERHCLTAELAAIIDLLGSLQFRADEVSLALHNSQAQVIRHAYRILKEELAFEVQLFVRHGERLRSASYDYLLQLSGADTVGRLYNLLQKGDYKNAFIPVSSLPLLERSCCRLAYLRGAFLAGGSINDPGSGAYHMEIVSESEVHAGVIIDIMQGLKLGAGMVERKGRMVVYLKNRMAIADLLTYMGAMHHRLLYEEVLMQKDMRNKANRERNFDQANADRMYVAGNNQQEAILWLQQHNFMGLLTAKLLEVAEARLDEPEAPLQDLADQLQISKSAVNHRLRKICKLAEDKGWRSAQQRSG